MNKFTIFLILIVTIVFLLNCDEPGDDENLIDNSPKIVFSSWVDGNQEIYTINYDGSDLDRLTNSPDEDINYNFSPDGKHIAFVSRRTNRIGPISRSRLGIYLMETNGRNQIRLTDDYYRAVSPIFSPNGNYIAFKADSIGNYNKLAIMNSDGTNRRFLTPEWSGYYYHQFSPDGSRILYTISPESYVGGIATMDINGGNIQHLTPGYEYATSPRYSSDGSKILFFSYYDLWVMDADGLNKVQLTNDVLNNFKACFTPEGDKIVFSSSRYVIHEDYEIYIINIDGTGETRLTFSPHDNQSLEISPDGSKIVFSKGRSGSIYLMDIDGSNQEDLLRDTDISGYSAKFQPQENF